MSWFFELNRARTFTPATWLMIPPKNDMSTRAKRKSPKMIPSYEKPPTYSAPGEYTVTHVEDAKAVDK